ncbi:hyaluronan synthase [Striga asiatica]|uniref:Hyaluronan synthase n=1 Tax=Striga asiatica TaxID=4170 RepID=A0A5A7QFX7_STRAF|nr:hyaluronan synthase [Striga asiatica]
MFAAVGACTMAIQNSIMAIAYCIVRDGQKMFYENTNSTLDFVLQQVDSTVENLQNVSGYLTTAKNVGVNYVFLPRQLLTNIDNVNGMIKTAANTLESATKNNTDDIFHYLDVVLRVVYVVALVIYVLVYLGVSNCIIYGPELFNILLGLLQLDFHFHEFISEWHIYRSPQAYVNYECCLTPSLYEEVSRAVNVSYGLHHYGPFLSDLVDCTFLRDTFTTIYDRHCPGLREVSQSVYTGLVMLSTGLSLTMIFWVPINQDVRRTCQVRSGIR